MLILFALLSLGAWGQTDSVRLGYMVRGKVRDAETGRVLESVHVSVPGRHHATVTNADGEFVLKSDRRIEAVQFSYLGYKSQWVAAGPELKVRLVPESIALPEASIISGEPADIVRAALSRVIPQFSCRLSNVASRRAERDPGALIIFPFLRVYTPGML